jgi:serine/threonine-protein kinase HipA
MTSEGQRYGQAFVWIWLPGQTEPVVAGKLTRQGDELLFNYGRRYLARGDAIALYDPELPLRSGILPLLPGMRLPSCIRDAAPDAWGRRVIINRKLGARGRGGDAGGLDELTYLLESGSDRIGALDFQHSPRHYEPRSSESVPLGELLEAAARVETGLPVFPALQRALDHGTSAGGARPKALIEEDDKKFLAKFSSATDLHSVVKAEFVAMRLAKLSGLNAAAVSLARAANKDVLLVERFDRAPSKDGWRRKCMVSALTLLQLDEMMARYASYEGLAEIIRHRFTEASATLAELFGRMTFNILSGNSDDHARNHSAFWDGRMLTLTPAYDICPQGRTGNEASQAMLIAGDDRMSRLSGCLDAANIFLLSEQQARAVIERQIATIGAQWRAVCAEAGLGETDRRLMWGRQFLNPFAFDDLEGDRGELRELAREVRAGLEAG